MKRKGILNSQLAGLVAALGHTDQFAVADCGLPVPSGVPVVDLAVVAGLPGFREVLDVILEEVVVEESFIASEALDHESGLWLRERQHLTGAQTAVSHEEFKKALSHCKFVVRTGADSAYANIILKSGVPF